MSRYRPQPYPRVMAHYALPHFSVVTEWVEKAEWERRLAAGRARGGFRPAFDVLPGGPRDVEISTFIPKMPREAAR